jgi:SAM-dependent methyltransferase
MFRDNPYALGDRIEFIERIGIGPDANVLCLEDELLASIVGERIEKRPVASHEGRPAVSSSSVISRLERLPFKSGRFDLVVSYHSLNFVSPERISGTFSEVKRVLKKEGRFAFLLRLKRVSTKKQKSDLLLSQLLEKLGIFWLHEHDFISRKLRDSGFEDINLEIVNRRVEVPERWIKVHLSFLREKCKEPELREKLKEYEFFSREGEELLPGIQWIAKV